MTHSGDYSQADALARRDALGRRVREVWIEWAKTQPNPKPSWLVPYDRLSEADKEADRCIGDALHRDGVERGVRMRYLSAVQRDADLLEARAENGRLWRLVREVRLNEMCQENQPDWMDRIDALEAQHPGSSEQDQT